MTPFYKFAKKYDIQLDQIPKSSPEWIQSLKARLFIANHEILRDSEKVRSYFTSLGLDFSGGIIQVKEGSTLYNSTSFRAALGYDSRNGIGLIGDASHTRQITDTVTATGHISQDFM